jgi:WhiB family redox-sensing transcriptional regulator
VSWQDDAACQGMDPNVFFPDPDYDDNEQITMKILVAKHCCDRCKVRSACLDFALRTKTTDGIFGGLMAAERRRL